MTNCYIAIATCLNSNMNYTCTYPSSLRAQKLLYHNLLQQITMTLHLSLSVTFIFQHKTIYCGFIYFSLLSQNYHFTLTKTLTRITRHFEILELIDSDKKTLYIPYLLD